MTPIEPTPWLPTRIVRVVRVLANSTSPALVVTDKGPGFAKLLGNPEGPEALACELIGTRLAAYLGLPTLDHAVIDVPSELEVGLGRGCTSLPGPAFVSRSVPGRVWGGSAGELGLIDNPEAIAGLVVLDTWLRNRDRHHQRGAEMIRNIRNVYLSEEGARRGRYRLIAMDQSEAIRQGRALGRQLTINEQREDELYGLFPEFVPYITRENASIFAERLRQLARDTVRAIVADVPRTWLPSDQVRDKLVEFCCGRAEHVGAHVEDWLGTQCKWQTMLSFE